MIGRRALMAGLSALTLFACAEAEEPRRAGAAGEEADLLSAEPEVVHHGGAIDALGITPPETPWSEMDAFDREMYMVGKVMPIMHELFAAHDPERYAEMECEHCHGDEMREVSFAMPSLQLFRVPEPNTPAWASMERNFGPAVEFMRETVTPVMGTLLGQEQASCRDCHAAP